MTPGPRVWVFDEAAPAPEPSGCTAVLDADGHIWLTGGDPNAEDVELDTGWTRQVFTRYPAGAVTFGPLGHDWLDVLGGYGPLQEMSRGHAEAQGFMIVFEREPQ